MRRGAGHQGLGQNQRVSFRWAANPRARNALTAFAHNARRQSPWAGRLYADARARGKRHPHATRIVARAWLRVIWACWHTNTPYHPHAHLAEQRLAAA
jgi:transposase